ncbi:MAG TPA: hypothetical protein VHO47_04240 [Candidatus Babeliales bacterium]|nr:hypothetical protein [Candidatus Babeliales bacterium]
MPKLTEQSKEILNNTIVECENCITACQDLVDMCSTSNGPECAEAVGKAVKQWSITIETCNQTIAWCKQELKDGSFAGRSLYDNCMQICHDVVDSCKKCIEECRTGNEGCMNATLDCIAKCDEAAECCDEIIE